MSDSKRVLEDLLTRSIDALENEAGSYRPLDKNGSPGGLVLLKQELPTLVVPDLHGRHDYLPDLLHFRYKNERVFDLLAAGKIQIVCVGDGMHSEGRGRERWRLALKEYKNGFENCPAMAEEMSENFQTMALVMKLKLAFPVFFHFLKGNHENILDEDGNGNHPFAKLAAEGPMTRKYVENFYGSDFLETFSRFEKNLPLLARGRFFLISHARPKQYYPIDDIVNYRSLPSLIEGMTWTRHNMARPGIIPEMLTDILGNSLDQRLWISGHTTTKDLYNYWNQEFLLEIHNPSLRVVVVIDPNERFDPDSHIQILPKRPPEAVSPV